MVHLFKLSTVTKIEDDEEEVKHQPGAFLNEIVIGLYSKENLKPFFERYQQE